MRISAELRDHEAAGSLAEELPYWGWLEDGRTCLTRTGELIAAGRVLRLPWSTGVRPKRSTACWAAGRGSSRGWTPTHASTSICSVGQASARARGPRGLRHRSGLAA